MAFVNETHKNAYLADLQLAEKELEQAQGRVETARRVIIEKFGASSLPESQTQPDKPKPGAKAKKISRSARNGRFISKSVAKKSPNTTVTETQKGDK